MEVSYKRDLHSSYLVLHKKDNSDDEYYCVHMLQANNLKGVIRPEPRTIDNRVLYYYDITSKQSMETLYTKNTISYERVKGLFSNLADLVEQTYEYLLNENDLILEPEHMYIDLATTQLNICYYPGYNKDLKNQIVSLTEHIMNKLEYGDRDAVLYVYNLYAVCRDEGFSFSKLLSAIRGSKRDIKDIRNPYANLSEAKPETDDKARENQIPVMPEKIYDDTEQYYYPLRTYIYTGASIIGGIALLILAISTRIIYTSMGKRIDYGKLTALLLVLLIIIGYLMKIIWNKNNRLTRIISRHEYIDPRPERISPKEPYVKKIPDEGKEKPSNPTVLLNKVTPYSGCYLEPEDNAAYDIININEFPFIIGKQKDNVDYFLDNEVISRYHVKITRGDNIYYITDLNSTNGTCLNGEPLSCYQRYEILKGNEVTIAGIRYFFQTNEE